MIWVAYKTFELMDDVSVGCVVDQNSIPDGNHHLRPICKYRGLCQTATLPGGGASRRDQGSVRGFINAWIEADVVYWCLLALLDPL